MAQHPVGQGTRVTLHFALSLKDGQVIDSNFNGKPATFDYGDGNLPGGFESLLDGLMPGDKRTFEVLPESAFGQRNPNNIQRFHRDQFSEEVMLEPGLMISFADARKSELPGTIQSVEGDEVVVDFNHPLAGHDLVFDVQILDVQPVS